MAKQSKSAKIEAKLEALQAELDDAKKAESEAADRELLRLIRRAGCIDEAMQFAQSKLDATRNASRRRARAKADAVSAPTDDSSEGTRTSNNKRGGE